MSGFHLKLVFCLALAICIPVCGCSKKTAPQPRGIVALTPAMTEIVLDLNLKDQLIATSPYTTDPQVRNIPKLQARGGIERITSLNPELILLHPTDDVVAANLQKLGFKTLSGKMDTLDEIQNVTTQIASALHKDTAGNELNRKMFQRLAENQALYGNARKHVNALVIIDRLDAKMMQFYIAQPPSFIAAILNGCGVDAITVTANMWDRIDAEKLIQINPDAIIYFVHDVKERDDIRYVMKKRFGTLSAIRHDKFFIYDIPEISVPSTRIAIRQTHLCKAIEPLFESNPTEPASHL